MRWMLLLLMLLAGCDEAVVLAGGEPQPDVKKLKVYKAGNLRFSYPGNWVKSEDDQQTEGIKIHTVWVKSKGNAMALVQTFVPPVAVDLDDYAREFLGGMRQEFKKSWSGLIRAGNIKTTTFSDAFLGKKRAGRRVQFMLKALGFPQPMEVSLRGARLARGSVVMGAMVPLKFKERVRVGYEQIRDSVRFGSGK